MESPYSKYIIPSADILVEHKDPVDSTAKSYGANFSKHVGFKKLGIHQVTLSPGSRTSLPHAESIEEEFVFVISGRPHVWVDGYVHELGPNCAVGFPAGTGIAHNFMNNTDSDVELLVLGERTKLENLCSFPVNPELKESNSGLWWADAPGRSLGPHTGRPGPIKLDEKGKEWPPFIVDCSKLSMSGGWHYPGDSETFGICARLTDTLGLKALGIGFETLAPGQRSAYPHSHSMEEEFVYILSGSADIWLNGFMHKAKPGDGVAFLPGTNIAHCVINNSQEPLTYIVVGETNADGDKVFYPLHPFRNEQCKTRKFFWENRPLNMVMGPHDGMPVKELAGRLSFRRVSSSEEDTVLGIFEKSPTYFQRVDGCQPTLKTVRDAVIDGPPKRVESYRKEFLMIEYESKPIGVVDIHINHPEPGIVYLGLLLIAENYFGKGLGRRAYGLVEHYVQKIYEARLMRLGVSEDNDVSGYWKKMDFVPNGRVYSWKGENKTTNVVEFDKLISEF